MSWIDPFDDLPPDFFEDEEVSETSFAEPIEDARQPKRAGSAQRSAADEILDAVSNVRPRKILPADICPKCESAARKRGPTVGPGMVTMKCRNPACRFEWPHGQVQERMEVLPVPVLPISPTAGPYRGEGGPPMDPNQPINRRLAEHIRRVRDHES